MYCYRVRRLFATLDDFLRPVAGGPELGRSMANHFFLRALFKYGTFDEYHFFLSNSAHKKLFADACQGLLDETNTKKKVELFTRLELPEQVQKHDYTVFHQSDHIRFFNALSRVRSRLNASFPVTAFIHSISYREYMNAYLEMCLVGVTSSVTALKSGGSGGWPMPPLPAPGPPSPPGMGMKPESNASSYPPPRPLTSMVPSITTSSVAVNTSGFDPLPKMLTPCGI